MDVNTRNELLIENLWWVRTIISRNNLLIQSLRLDYDDVFQDLCMVALKAIDNFDSRKSDSMSTHVMSRMQYEIKNLKRRYIPHGMTAARNSNISFRSLDYQFNNGLHMEIPCEDSYSNLDMEDILSLLSPTERGVVLEKMEGVYHRKKEQRAILATASQKIMNVYNKGGAVACC